MLKNKISLIGIITFLVLLFLALLFYKERTVFLDISFHLFTILESKKFAFQNYRFGAFFTQLFPLLGSKFNLPLKLIAKLYSISFVLLPFFTFLFIQFVTKNVKLSIAYLLYNILICTHTFYWVQSELSQGMAFLFIYLALIDRCILKNKTSFSFILISIILIPLISITHPLLIFPITFIIIFYFLEYRRAFKFLLSLFLGFSCAFLLKSIFFKTEYDSQAIMALSNIKQYFPSYFSLAAFKNYFHYFSSDYLISSILLIIVIGKYLIDKEIVKMLLVIAFYFGYSFIVNINYPNGAYQFYLENQYLLLGFFLAIPLVYDILPLKSKPILSIATIFIICVMSLYRIYNTHQFYTDRLVWHKTFLEKTSNFKQQKIILINSQKIQDELLMTWGSSYEFWLLSTMEDGISRSIIIEEPEFKDCMDNNEVFISKWGCFEYEALNGSQYFNFIDASFYTYYEELD